MLSSGLHFFIGILYIINLVLSMYFWYKKDYHNMIMQMFCAILMVNFLLGGE